MADRQVKVEILGDSKSLDAAVLSSEAKLDGFGQKMSGIGKVAGVAFAAVGVAAIGAVAGLAAIGEQFDASFDSIRIKTGQTGDTLKGLDQSFKNVLGNVPDNMGKVSDAIGTVNQKLGLTGAPLEAVSTQLLTLSRITGTDLATNLDSVTSLFNAFGVSAQDQSGKLDELFRASQASGVSVGDLASQMAGAGPQLQAAGLSFDQSAGLLALLAKNGLAAGDVVPALGKAMATAAKEGKPAGDVFKDTFNAIKNAPDDVTAAGDALQIFGAKAGPKLAELVRTGKLSYEDFTTAIQNGNDTILGAAAATDDWREKLDTLKNKALVALEPIASAVFDGLTSGVGVAADWLINTGGPALAAAFSAIAGYVGQLWTNIQPLAAKGIALVLAAFDAIRVWFVANWPRIQAVFAAAWLKIQAGFQWLIQHKGELISAAAALGVVVVAMFLDWAASAAAAALATLAAAAPFLVLVAAIAGLGVAFYELYTHVDGFRNAVDAVVSYARTDLVPTLQSIGTAITEGVKIAVDWFTNTALPAILAFFQQVSEQAQSFANGFKDRWNDIKTSVENIVKDLVIAVGIAIAPLVLIWQAAHDQIVAVLVAAWEFMKAYVQAALLVVQGIIDVVLGLLSGDWGTAWDGIKEILQGVWDGIVALVQLSITIVQNLITGGLAVIGAAWSAAWAGIQAGVAAAWESIKSAVSTGVAAVVSFIGSLPGQAGAAMAAFGPTIVGVIEAAGSDALGAAEDLVSNVVTEIGRLPGQVASAIAGAAGTIVGNITSALGSAINSAIDYINNHLPSLDVGPIHIGVPNLPHVNFASGGVVPGLPGAPVLAVVHGGEVVQNAAQQAHTLAAISNGAGIRGGGGGSKTYNINVNVAPGTDPGEVGRQTVMAIQAYERRAGSSWRAA